MSGKEKEFIHLRILEFLNTWRDTADEDYISSRILMRKKLVNQGYWNALQAIEKYLKGILFFNWISIIKINDGHDLNALLKKLEEINDIKFDFSEEILVFINDINSIGKNRYFEKSFFTNGDEIQKLDKTVWSIRKYCQYFRENNIFDKENPIRKEEDGSIDHQLNLVLKVSENHSIFDYKLPGGFLEKVIKFNRYRDLLEDLTYQNKYYNKYDKYDIRTKINKVISSWTMKNSCLIKYPEIYEKLEGIMKFSPETRNYFNSLKNRLRI